MKKKLVVAVGLALIALLSMWLYTRSIREEAVGGARVAVLVAAQDIPPGARLTKAMLAMRDVPQAYLHQGSIQKGEENQIIGRPVAGAIAQGQMLLWTDFEGAKAPSSGRLSSLLQKGQRAFTLPVDLSGSIAGMLRPGDRVDILGTFARNQGADWATVTLLQNVLVMAVGDQRGDVDDAPHGAPRNFSSITVAVDLEAAELLAFATQRGPISIALRPQDDMETIEDVPDKNFGDIFELPKRTAFQRRQAKKIELLRPQ
jgi:pilus assembly protein CpaB